MKCLVSALDFSLQSMSKESGYSQLDDRQDERFSDDLSSKLRLLKVNSIEVVFRCLSRIVLANVERFRAETAVEIGTAPSTDGNTRHRTMFLGQLNECGNQRLPREFKAEDGGVWGCDAKK